MEETRDAQAEMVRHILEEIGGEVFDGSVSGDKLILCEGWMVCVMPDGSTSRVNGMSWETGWEC